MSTRKLNALNTRKKILNAAVELISANKFENLTVDDITRSANVAKGTFYTYFKRKEDVVFEICRPLFAKIEQRMQNMTDKGIWERLCFYFESFIEEVERYGVNMCRTWVKEVIDPENAPKNFDTQKLEYDMTMLRNILTAAVENNELKQDTPVEILVNIIISQLYGMMICWCMSDMKFEPKEWTKTFGEYQLKPLLAPYLADI